MDQLIVLCGPTGVGKSVLAMRIAEELDAEIVSADTGQVYRGFDIGTAKPSAEECLAVPHHCIDLWDPDFRSDAVLWQRAADKAITDIRGRAKRVLVVGGTAFYVRTLLHGLFEGPDPDPKLRQRLQQEFQEQGGEALHARLKEIDPEAACRIHPNDPVRLVRALEVYEQTGTPISIHQAKHRFKQARYPFIMIGLERDRAKLYARINARAEQMMATGWQDEAKLLYEKWGGDVPAFQLIGYRELRHYFMGELSEDKLIPAIQQASRQYAKRQLTWLRYEKNLQWLDAAKPVTVLLHEIATLFERGTSEEV